MIRFPYWHQPWSDHCHDSVFRALQVLLQMLKNLFALNSSYAHSCTGFPASKAGAQEDSERSSVTGRGKGHCMKDTPVHQMQPSKVFTFVRKWRLYPATVTNRILEKFRAAETSRSPSSSVGGEEWSRTDTGKVRWAEQSKQAEVKY